jgi:hypothetical protein
MKQFVTSVRAVAVLALAVGGAASSALADGVITIEVPAGWRASGFSGGAFRVNPVSGYNGHGGGPGATGSSFLSFCLELDEFINADNTTQYNTHIDVSALHGGVGGPDPDPINYITANLYKEFRGVNSFGNLAGLGGDGVSNGNETRALQRALWFSEEEIGDASDGITDADFQGDALAHRMYNWAVGAGDNGLRGVRVLRLFNRRPDGTDGGVRQDLLTIVPLPPAAWVGLTSLAGIGAFGYVRRRSFRA